MAIVSFSRQWDVDIKIGLNSRRDDKSESEDELRIKNDCTRRQSSWDRPNWERWKSTFHRPQSACFWILGAVGFIGYLSNPSGGEWRGIELDHPHPRGNDGFFDGVRLFHLWAEALHVCSTVVGISSQKCWKCYCSNEYFFRNDRFYSNEHSTLLLFKCKLLWYRVN